MLNAAPLDQLKPSIARLLELAAAQGRSLAIGLRVDLLAREDAAEARHDAERHLAQTGEDRAGYEHRTLVGSYAEIEQRLFDYAQAGITSFVLGATPHLEDAWRVGEHLLPRLRARLAQDRQAA